MKISQRTELAVSQLTGQLSEFLNLADRVHPCNILIFYYFNVQKRARILKCLHYKNVAKVQAYKNSSTLLRAEQEPITTWTPGED